MLTVTISNALQFRITPELKRQYPGLLQAIRGDLVIPNPEHIEAERLGRSTRRIPRELHIYDWDQSSGVISIPRGYWARLQEHLARARVAFEVECRMLTLPPVNFGSRIQLRDYQAAPVQAMVQAGGGILEAPPGSGKCLADDSLVFTNRGLVRLNELAPFSTPDLLIRDRLMVDAGHDSEVATGIYDGGVSQTVKVRLRFGYEIEGTPEHPVLTFNEGFRWKTLGALAVGDYVAIKRRASVWGQTPRHFEFKRRKYTSCIIEVGPLELTETAARAIGLIVAEAYLGNRTCLHFSNTDEENLQTVERWIAPLGLELKKHRGENCDYTLASVQIRDFLRFVGVKDGVSADQEVPAGIRMGGKEIARAFLQGYIEGEGYVAPHHIEVSSASRKLLRDVQVMLLGFGILSSLSSKYNKKLKKTYYRLYIYEMERFAQEIGFITQRKRECLKNAISACPNRNPNVCLVPHVKESLRALYAAARKTPGWKYTDGKLFWHYVPDRNCRNPSKAQLRRILDRFRWLDLPEVKILSEAASDDYEFLSVEEITTGLGRVIDLCVPSTKTFVGNGVVCHNTSMGLEILARIGQPALWLTHTRDLMDQARDRAAEFLSMPRGEIGMIGAGQDKAGPRLTVALVQALAQRGSLGALTERFGAVLIDEVHHAPARTWQFVVGQFPARYRFGVTGSLKRADGLEVIAHLVLGPTVAEITRDQVRVSGGTITPRLVVIRTEAVSQAWEEFQRRHEAWAALKANQAVGGFIPREPRMDYHAVLDEILADPERNRLIVETVLQHAAGHCSLVLSERVAHCEALAAMLRVRAPVIRAAVIHGGLGKTERRQIIGAARSGELDVLCAVDIAKEGLDIPRLDRLHRVAGGRDPVEVKQTVGRIQRVCPGKADAVVFDYVDFGIGVLRAQHYARRKVYKELGMIG